MSTEEIRDVPVEDIDINPNQSRELFDEAELAQLAASLIQNGQLQAGVAWYDPGRARLILICGERRLRALKLAKLPTMSLKILRGAMTQAQLLEINITENIQRASLNPIERGMAFRRMMQLEDMSARDVAARLKVTDSMVSRDLCLLNLSPALQERVVSGELPASVGATLSRMEDDETRRCFAERFLKGGISREGIAQEVARKQGRKTQTAKAERLACRLDGVSITFSGSALTVESLLKALDQVRRKAKELSDGSDIAELARLLKAS